MKKNRIIIVIAILTALSLCFETAATSSEESLSEIREKIEQKEEELSQGEEKESSLASQVTEMESEISQLESAISEGEVRLGTLEVELEEAQEKVETQNKNLNARLRNMYKSGSVGFLDVLLDSSSFSEFLTNLDLVKEIYSSDRSVLNGLQEAHDEVESKKQEVETLQAELKESKQVAEDQKAEIEAQKNKIAASNEETEKMLDELHADANAITERIRQESAAANSSSSGSSSGGSSGSSSGSSSSSYTGGEMAWPVPSVGTSNITSLYGWRVHPIFGVGRGHDGVDIGASYGAAVVAAEAGTVIMAEWYGGYGNCVVIDHGGGVTTLYGHNSGFNVSVGQRVSRGQTIAFIGSTGNSTGPHCHFEVRINGSTTDPLDYIL